MSQTGSVWCRTCLQHAQEPGERGRHPCRWQHWKKIFRHLERRQDKQVAGIRNGTGFDHDAYFDATTGKFSSCVLTLSSDACWVTTATPLSAEEADLVTYFRTLTWPTSPQPLRCELQVRCSRHSSLVLSSTTLREEEIMEFEFLSGRGQVLRSMVSASQPRSPSTPCKAPRCPRFCSTR